MARENAAASKAHRWDEPRLNQMETTCFNEYSDTEWQAYLTYERMFTLLPEHRDLHADSPMGPRWWGMLPELTNPMSDSTVGTAATARRVGLS